LGKIPAESLDKSTRWYNRLAWLYDFSMGLMEGTSIAQWRALLWSKIEGKNILEVGVGTGGSFPFYPPQASIKAIEISRNMLKRAKKKALKNNIRVQLALMDVQRLAFADSSFDTVAASLVFCSVPDPLLGLNEVRRVVRWGGKVVMLEHVISDRRFLGLFMNLINSPIAALTGEYINRDTIETVKKSGLIVENVIRLSTVFRIIEARKEKLYFLK
jgi:phosphatidylethanolamine/phosphatidyl-N-methylethanolamine N-methyltransferase